MPQVTPRDDEDDDPATGEQSGQLVVDGPGGDRLVLRLPDITAPRAPAEPGPAVVEDDPAGDDDIPDDA